MRALFLFLGVFLAGHGVLGTMQTYEEALQTQRLTILQHEPRSDAYLLTQLHTKYAMSVIAKSKGHETNLNTENYKRSEENLLSKDLEHALHDEDDYEYKRNYNIYSPVYTTNSYKFPVDSFIKNAMIAILGEDGVLEKGGFYMDGYIKKDGTAFIKMIKSFGNRTRLIDEIERVRLHNDPNNPLSVIVHLLLTTQDVDNLIAWQKEQIQKGHFKQDDPCAPKMIVMYKCCTTTVLPLLGPEFGSLRIAID